MNQHVKNGLDIVILIVTLLVGFYVITYIHTRSECQKYGYTGAHFGLSLTEYCSPGITLDEARVNYQNKRIFMDQENFDIAIKNEYNKGVNIMYKACVENLKQQVEEQKQQPSINILDILIKSLGIFG